MTLHILTTGSPCTSYVSNHFKHKKILPSDKSRVTHMLHIYKIWYYKPCPHRLRVVAFVGGLDLTDGRYDTPQHPLFSTLLSKHAAPDFYQNCVSVRGEAGPRQPWHDIHRWVGVMSRGYHVVTMWLSRGNRVVVTMWLPCDCKIVHVNCLEMSVFDLNIKLFICHLTSNLAVLITRFPGDTRL